MSDPNVHTVPRGDGWANELESSTSVLARFDTKVGAVTAGLDSASVADVEHALHNADGTIGGKHSYGNDPYPPSG